MGRGNSHDESGSYRLPCGGYAHLALPCDVWVGAMPCACPVAGVRVLKRTPWTASPQGRDRHHLRMCIVGLTPTSYYPPNQNRIGPALFDGIVPTNMVQTAAWASARHCPYPDVVAWGKMPVPATGQAWGKVAVSATGQAQGIAPTQTL
ncbi:MAG TPA: hypothetical protein VKY19_11915 [Ktedonosporobacter sp.]|nr:hypothetical protein [Ktedonosporobacter sp.]